jgi:transcriptional regulator with XRE-family HTH domain
MPTGSDNRYVIIDPMKAARLLRIARRRAGLSQRDLAQLTGVAQPAIARIERGVVSPTVDTLDRLLAGAGATLEASPRLGIGVDRSLIAEMLRRTPEERLLAAATAARGVASLVEAIGRGPRP